MGITSPMRSSSCPSCGLLVFFDDTACVRCGTALAYRPSAGTMVALADDDVPCANRDLIGCSFLVEDEEAQCRACRLTRTRPPDDDADGMATWTRAEQAKRMLLDQTWRLGVDIEGVVFDLKSGDHEPVTTGHADGVVTIDVREADDVVRTRMRERMGEAYRTMLGHFRHEIGHYLWMTEVDGTEHLEGFRQVFGDERADYAAALEAHYASDDPPGWQDSHVSVYATAHPWEDFAETVAHWLHIRAALETAASFGVQVDGSHPVLDVEPDPDDDATIRDLIDQWLPLTYALNAVNRSMGADPLYPFVLAPTVIDKLGWVHRLLDRT